MIGFSLFPKIEYVTSSRSAGIVPPHSNFKSPPCDSLHVLISINDDDDDDDDNDDNDDDDEHLYMCRNRDMIFVFCGGNVFVTAHSAHSSQLTLNMR